MHSFLREQIYKRNCKKQFIKTTLDVFVVKNLKNNKIQSKFRMYEETKNTEEQVDAAEVQETVKSEDRRVGKE